MGWQAEFADARRVLARHRIFLVSETEKRMRDDCEGDGYPERSRMKASTRRWLGAVFVGASLLAALIVSWSGAWPMSLRESRTHSAGSVTVTTEIYDVHWPSWLLILLLETPGFGVLSLLIPGREKTNS